MELAFGKVQSISQSLSLLLHLSSASLGVASTFPIYLTLPHFPHLQSGHADNIFLMAWLQEKS